LAVPVVLSAPVLSTLATFDAVVGSAMLTIWPVAASAVPPSATNNATPPRIVPVFGRDVHAGPSCISPAGSPPPGSRSIYANYLRRLLGTQPRCRPTRRLMANG
jgi:hypothetical protein